MVILINQDPSSSERAISSVSESTHPNQLTRTDVARKKKVVLKVDTLWLIQRCTSHAYNTSLWVRVLRLCNTYKNKNKKKVDIWDDIGKKKAMEAVARLLGVESVSVNSDHSRLSVTGADIDPVSVVSKLRKLTYVEILSVGPAVSSSITQRAGSRRKELLADKSPMDDVTVSSIEQLMKRMDTSAQAGASSTSLFPLPTQTCEPAPLYSAQVSSMNSFGQETTQILEQTIVKSMSFEGDIIRELKYEELINSTSSFPPVRDNDVMVDRKRRLNEKEMSIKRIDDLEEMLAARKALLTAEMVALEELIAKDEQIEELNRALEVEKMKNAELASSKENDYLKGVADCRSKILDRYPELDLSWMEDSLHGRTNEVPLTE